MIASAPLGTSNGFGQPLSDAPEVLNRLNRWQMLRLVQSFECSEEERSRTGKCFRSLAFWSGGVNVLKDVNNHAFYRGLVICGSPWACPVCSSRISETRSFEIVQGIDAWMALGGHVSMLTLTLPHAQGESLELVLDKFSQARKLFRNRKTSKRIFKRAGETGSIRALEVTFGGNGWHVHSHELLFTESPIDDNGELLKAWQNAVMDTGWRSPNGHGLDLVPVWSSSDYLSKYGKDRSWGPGKELAKSHVKRGREGGLTPWDFLRRIMEGQKPGYYRSLWREYTKAFKGRNQIRWTRGLKSRFGINEVSDQDAAEGKDVLAALVGILTYEQWRVVLATENRGQVLRAAEAGGWYAVMELIGQLIGVTNEKSILCAG